MTSGSQNLANFSPEERRALLAELLQQKARASTTAQPVTYGQKALWFIYQLAPESAAYNVAFAVSVHSPLDVAAMRRAYQHLIDRHSALRTTISQSSETLMQIVAGSSEPVLDTIDASQWDDSELQQQVQAVYERPFDLERGPLHRMTIFTRSASEHVLLLAVHHIVVDGWSVGILTDELYTLYSAKVTGVPAQLPAVEQDFSAFATWQNALLASPEGERLRDYWLAKLGGELPLLDLPIDKRRPTTQRLRGNTLQIQFGADLLHRVQAFAKAEHTTLYTVLLSVYYLLLYRYTGQTDLVIGSPMVGRSRMEFQKTVGYLVSPVPLRSSIDGTQSFRSLLATVRHTVLEALDHQGYPFALLMDQLKPRREAGRSPVIEVMFNLITTQRFGQLSSKLAGGGSVDGAGAGELHLGNFPVRQESGQFDLSLSFADSSDALIGEFKYNSDLFEEATIARMMGHYQTLLENVVTDAGQPLAMIPILPQDEREQIMGFNATERPYNLDRRLHDLVAEQIARTPEAVALRFEGNSMTYAELEARANQVAHALQERGVGPNMLVGVFAERSFEMVIGLLAIVKAGGAYVPLDPTYPAERIAMMLEDLAPLVILAAVPPVALTLLPDGAWTVIDLYADSNSLARLPSTPPTSNTTADDLAYVLFTSGSTGRPKGAGVHHSAIINRLLWMQDRYSLASGDVVLQKTPFSFDVSVWEFFLPLLTGTPLVIARPEGHKDSGYLIDLIESEGITIIHFVPSMLQVFLKDPGAVRCASLKQVICGGEALSNDLQERIFQVLPDVKLYNSYGPTEAAIGVSDWRCQRGSMQHSIPIGYPVANTKLYILDHLLQLVPIGVSGELHIGGVQVGKGYLGRPELTGEKFIKDPFGEPGDRLYKTGDLVRHLPNGAIEYKGRLDHQVKIRGFRIELGEIETTLGSFPGIHKAVVITHRDSRGDTRLVAYLVTGEGKHPGAGELRAYLGRSLPDYMVPSAFLFLNEMPLTSSGKVNRNALPAPEAGRARVDDNFVAPSTATEQSVATIWREVLAVPRVGVYDNFFDLGGHSLSAMEVIAACERMLGVRMNPGLFRAQTLGQIAASYDEMLSEKSTPVTVTQAAAHTPAAPEPAREQSGLASRIFGAVKRAVNTTGNTTDKDI